jgi:mannitol-specific phosphotransferase system IIBC component
MNIRKLSMLMLLGSMLAAPLAMAQITHVDMRVEGMT